MGNLALLTGCARKEPTQRRGEKRVETLLAAGVAEFAEMGYDAATMSAIAARARAPIGSLYQFFPNKQSVARAIRTRQIENIEKLWVRLKPEAVEGGIRRFVDRFVELMLVFVDDHPAFLPLLDAPSSTRPIGPRHRLRTRLEEMLASIQPRHSAESHERTAEMVLNLNRALLDMYGRSGAEDREWIVVEYRAILGDYLGRRLGSKGSDAAPGGVGVRTGVASKPRTRRLKAVRAASR